MYLFNPWHDLALANFEANYTPPAAAVKMAEDLAVLPVWYGKGDLVIAEGELNRSFVDAIKKIFPVSSDLIPFSDICLHPGEEIIPWGWSPALRKKLLAQGAAEQQIPTIEDLRRLREYSNRQNAVLLLRDLKAGEVEFCGESYFFTNMEELLAYQHSTPGNKVLKMPLSGSGKGLIWILGEITDKQVDWCRRVIRLQGGVVAEPVLSKIQDFAMEFYIDRGKASFVGYSIFGSTASGAYKGNELLSDRRIEEKLSANISFTLMQQLRETLLVKLAGYFPLYTGYAGVDMMICETAGGYRVQPCVEINMRMNMGVAAHLFFDSFVNSSSEGKFVVDYFKKQGSALSFHEKMQRESPLQVTGGKILSGYLSLTPVAADSRYTAYVVVG
ncbi:MULTISPECIES: hypothetical protein [Proteiniphilum]|jgi:hypothetical protein|uniref:hypothetical protein n=1 Tax=Proteiniphilum TaxID=294702 RepID=UPI001EEBCF5B|nr:MULTISPECIES: hypothetical protein [Proteiniphilum]ULB35406.1 hypothetical protein KDN43_05050 [Proteiniphilum propionicum]